MIAFNVFMNFSVITDLPLLCFKYMKISFLSNHSCITLFLNYLPWSTHDLFGLKLLFTILIKAFRAVLPFLSYKGLTHAYLVKATIKNNKYVTFLFFEDNVSISAKSAAKILSLNLAKAFLFLNFLVTGLSNSSVRCLFILAPDTVFLSRNL